MGKIGEICKQIEDTVINITGELNYKEGKKESEVKTKALIIYCINKFTGMNGIKISELLGIDKSVVNYHLNKLNICKHLLLYLHQIKQTSHDIKY